jgi:hypothetical protein
MAKNEVKERRETKRREEIVRREDQSQPAAPYSLVSYASTAMLFLH